MYVVMTTEHRGVFFGKLDADDSKLPEHAKLLEAQMCVYWSQGGVMSLASSGPDDKCRITEAVVVLDVWKVTAVMQCSPEAVKRWKAAPWG